MKNKLEFHSEACFKEVDVPKNNKQIFPFPCKSCLALFKSVFLCKNRVEASFSIFKFYILLWDHFVVTVLDSFIYWFLCEAEDKHKRDGKCQFIYKMGTIKYEMFYYA